MPSPICLANGVSITSTLNFATSQSVVLSLADKTGVNSWLVEVGRRMIAANQTIEGNHEYGWIADLNQIINLISI